MPDYIRRRLRARETAGVILFGANGGDRAAWRGPTRSLQGAAGGARARDGRPGGRRHPHGGLRGARRSAAVPGPAGQRAARRARPPVAAEGGGDQREPRARGRRAARRARSWPAARSPATSAASRRGRARRCAGCATRRVAATAKHFPGLGGATVNTDDGPATVTHAARSRPRALQRGDRRAGAARDALARELPRAAMSAGSRPSHARSSPGLLRERLGFEGVIVTDSLEADGRAGPLRDRRRGGALDQGRRRPDPDDGLGELERRLPAPARRGAPAIRPSASGSARAPRGCWR